MQEGEEDEEQHEDAWRAGQEVQPRSPGLSRAFAQPSGPQHLASMRSLIIHAFLNFHIVLGIYSMPENQKHRLTTSLTFGNS